MGNSTFNTLYAVESLIGRAILDNVSDSDANVMLEELSPECFVTRDIGKLFKAFQDVYPRSGTFSMEQFIAYAIDHDGYSFVTRDADGFFEKLKSNQISNLLVDVSSATRIVKQAYLTRRLKSLTEAKLSELSQPDTAINPASTAGEISEIAKDIIAANISNDITDLAASSDDIERLRLSSSRIKGLPSPFERINVLLDGGLRPGELCVIAARPGVGKTTLALMWAMEVALRQRKKVLFKSLEMTREELAIKVTSAISGVAMSEIKKMDKNYTGGQIVKVREALAYQKQIGNFLVIDDGTKNTLADLASAARSEKARGGLDLLIVDYIQLMTAGNRNSRHEDVSEITRGLKLLAKDLKIPVIALSQLNRESEKNRKDTRPRLDNLRSSGSIEQDANQVILLWRKEIDEEAEDIPYVAVMEQPDRYEYWALLDKNRGGPTGKTKLFPLLHVSLFREESLE